MTTFEKLAEIIVKARQNRIATSAIKPESRLREDLEMDSICLVEAVVLAEEAFSVKISQDDVSALKRVSDIVAYIDRAIAK